MRSPASPLLVASCGIRAFNLSNDLKFVNSPWLKESRMLTLFVQSLCVSEHVLFFRKELVSLILNLIPHPESGKTTAGKMVLDFNPKSFSLEAPC